MNSSSDDSKPYGQWVRERRQWLGLSQVELARRVGISSVQICNIETGRTKRPLPNTRFRLGQVLAGSAEPERGVATGSEGPECEVAAGSGEPGDNVVVFFRTPKKAHQEDDAEPYCSFCNRPLAMAQAIAWLSDTGNHPAICWECLNKLNSIFAEGARYDNDGKPSLRLVRKAT